MKKLSLLTAFILMIASISFAQTLKPRPVLKNKQKFS